MRTTLLVDLGGTRLKAATLPVDGAVPRDVVAVAHEGQWRRAVRSMVSRFAADEVALCVPGVVDGARVTALPGKLAGLERVSPAEAFGVPVTLVVNDAIAFGVGEAVCGAGAGEQRVVGVTLGTGVGCAVVEDGRPLGTGPLGGGLLGGQLVLAAPTDTGGVDTSGRSGTFEALCRAGALVEAVPGAADVTQAYALLDAADPAAVTAFSRYREHLVAGLTALSLAHAPSRIVVGGGAAQPGLLDGVEQALAVRLWQGQAVSVRLALLGDAAGLAGLAVLLRDAVPV